MSKKTKLKEQVIETQALIDSGIPKRFWTLSRKDYFGSEDALRTVERYVEKHKECHTSGYGLLLRGPKSSGKTFLLTYLLRCLLLKGYAVKYHTLDELTDMMLRPDGSSFRSKFFSVDFLAIDSITGVNEGNKSALRKVTQIRRDEGLPTLLGTPYMLDESGDDLLKFHYGTDIERMLEICKVVDCSVDPFKMRRYYNKLNPLD